MASGAICWLREAEYDMWLVVGTGVDTGFYYALLKK
jgi:hypothetical protein